MCLFSYGDHYLILLVIMFSSNVHILHKVFPLVINNTHNFEKFVLLQALGRELTRKDEDVKAFAHKAQCQTCFKNANITSSKKSVLRYSDLHWTSRLACRLSLWEVWLFSFIITSYALKVCKQVSHQMASSSTQMWRLYFFRIRRLTCDTNVLQE